MQIDHYLDEYMMFHAEFCPTATPEQKLCKLCEEIEEHIEAVNSHDEEDIINETIDVMNTAIAYLHSVGVKDPLHAGWAKLQKTAEKYRRGSA
jgi:phosphoribosyl-ATP pyrophosphohydrolase